MTAAPPPWIGTLPGWITAITTVGGVVWAFLRFGLGWRKQSLDSEADIRDHYAKEVAALRQGLLDQEKHFRGVVGDADKRHEECMADRDILRKRISELEDIVQGLYRVIAQASVNKVLMLDTEVPAEIREAAERAGMRLDAPRGRQ